MEGRRYAAHLRASVAKDLRGHPKAAFKKARDIDFERSLYRLPRY